MRRMQSGSEGRTPQPSSSTDESSRARQHWKRSPRRFAVSFRHIRGQSEAMMRQARILVVVGLVLMLPICARAQAPGDRTEVLHPLVFEMMNDNITLDPNAN